MKKLLSYIHWKHLRHLYHVEEKKIPHYHRLLQTFFHSRNGKLTIIIVVLAILPITVLGVQTTQNYSQFAAEPTDVPKCDGASNYKAEPNPVNSGEFVTFSKTDGTEVTVDTNHFGNGYDQASCVSGDIPGSLKCKAKSRGSGAAIQYSKWQKFPGGLEVCWYAIAQAPTATRNPSRVVNTPRPSGGVCTGELKGGSSIGCTADNKPRLRVAWDLRGGTEGKCFATLIQGSSKWVLTDDCSNISGSYIDTDKDKGKIDLKPGADYTLKIENGSTSSCQPAQYTATTANCGQNATPAPGNGTPTSTPRPNQPTNTPPAGQPTNTPVPEQGGSCGSITSMGGYCRGNGSAQIRAQWKVKKPSSGNANGCNVYLQAGNDTKTIKEGAPCEVRGNTYNIDTFEGGSVVNGGSYILIVDNGDDCVEDKAVRSRNTQITCQPTVTPVPAAQAQKETTIGARDIGQELLDFFNL